MDAQYGAPSPVPLVCEQRRTPLGSSMDGSEMVTPGALGQHEQSLRYGGAIGGLETLASAMR